SKVRARERVDVVDPDDGAPFKRLPRSISREVLDERGHLVLAGLLRELGYLEREVAGAQYEEWLPPMHGGDRMGGAVWGRTSSVSAMQRRRRMRIEFQPPSFGEEEVEAVAETVRSGGSGRGRRRDSSRSVQPRYSAHATSSPSRRAPWRSSSRSSR